MKQPDSIDIGTHMDIAKYRLQTAKEDLDTAELTYKLNNSVPRITELITVSFIQFVLFLQKREFLLNDTKIQSVILIRTISIQKFFLKNLAGKL